MTFPRRIARALALAAVGWIAVLLVLAAVGCGTQKPRPLTPADPASCDRACAHVDSLPCGFSARLCSAICDRVAVNQPEWPTCMSAATSCAAMNACSGTHASAPPADGGAARGPGEGRSGP